MSNTTSVINKRQESNVVENNDITEMGGETDTEMHLNYEKI